MSAMMRPLQPQPLNPADLSLAPVYARLGAPFHQPVAATSLAEPRMVHFNAPLAGMLGLEAKAETDFLEILAGNRPWPGYAASASVYAGHQFGTWVPQLGDGRALLIAELLAPDGERVELQLKGAGQTPYSRGLDGRAVLRSSIREYLGAEAMHALGVPTTRCLSLVGSSQPVVRETAETAAVVCRTAASFVRFGQFEYFAARSQLGPMARLADHVIAEHFPHLQGQPNRYAAWLGEVVERTARLIAQWQLLGFCHGVMNTDNFSVLGLTLDYGPFGFMDRFRQYHVCNHSDYEGRYAYSAQPEIGLWNCERLAQALSPLLAEKPEQAAEVGQDVLQGYAPVYKRVVMQGWADKLGFREQREGDSRLVNEFLGLLQRSRGDFTRSFRLLARIRADSDALAKGVREEFADIKAFDAWVADYRGRLRGEQNTDDAARAERMNRVNPKYVLRNHLAQIAIDKAQLGDYSEVATLAELLRHPYDEQPEMENYAAEPPDYMRNIEVSCSS
ncbi:MAG: YdiU family protein [Methylococcus sp.]|nr:YdiU family protein [Methylococcus sp.]